MIGGQFTATGGDRNMGIQINVPDLAPNQFNGGAIRINPNGDMVCEVDGAIGRGPYIQTYGSQDLYLNPVGNDVVIEGGNLDVGGGQNIGVI